MYKRQLPPASPLHSNDTVDTRDMYSPDALHTHRSNSVSVSLCSSQHDADSASRDENIPEGRHSDSGPFPEAWGHHNALPKQPLSSLQAMPSSAKHSPDNAPYQPTHQQEAGACGAVPQGRVLQGQRVNSAGNHGTTDTLHTAEFGDLGVSSMHDSEARSQGGAKQGGQAEAPSAAARAAVATSAAPAPELHNQGGESGHSCVEHVDWANGSEVLGHRNEAGICGRKSESPKQHSSGSIEDLFPETNFEDSEDDGGSIAMFKSCMNDHSAYDTKRSRILELSSGSTAAKEAPPASDVSCKNHATPFDGVPMQQGASSHDGASQPPSLTGTEPTPLPQLSTVSSSTSFTDVKGADTGPERALNRSCSKASSCSEHFTASCGKTEAENNGECNTNTAPDKPSDLNDAKDNKTPLAPSCGVFAPTPLSVRQLFQAPY